MSTVPLTPNEEERLAALRSYHILDTATEQDFDELTELASVVCGTPIALISLVDKDRQWFKSHKGLPVTETDRDQSFCAHAINQPDELMEVEDAHLDARFVNNPLVIGEPHITFYAGFPLVNEQGHALGSLCVIDTETKKLTDAQRSALKILAKQVVDKLEKRRKTLELEQANQRLLTAQAELQSSMRMASVNHMRFQNLVREANVGIIVLIGEETRVEIVNRVYGQLIGRSVAQLLNKPLFEVIPEAEAYFKPIIDKVRHTGESFYLYDIPYTVYNEGQMIEGYLNLVYQPYVEDGETVSGVIVLCHDVTEQYKAHQLLKDKEMQLQEVNQELQAIAEEQTAINEELIFTNKELAEAQTAAIQTKELLDQAVSSAKIGTWSIDPDTRVLNASPRLKELFGYDADEEMPYDAAITHIRDDYRERIDSAVNEALANGESYDLIYPLTGHHDQQLRWVRTTGRFFDGNEQMKSYLSGTVMDITEHVLARQAVEESEQRFRALAEGSEIMISINDADGNVEYVNQAWLKLTGITQADMLAYGWENFLHPDDQQPLLEKFKEGIKSRAGFTVEFRMMDKDQKPRWIYTKVNPRLLPDGSYAGSISSSIDVTAQIETRNELHEANSRLNIALDAGALGSTEVDIATGAMICTRQFKKCFGRAVDEEFIYPQMFEAMLPQYRDEIKRRVKIAQDTHSIYQAEYEITWPDGSIHWISAYGRGRYDEKDQPVKMVGIIADITERKNDEQRKSDFIGIVSHELRSPLTSLNGYVQLLNLKAKRNEDVATQGILDKTQRQINKMRTLITGFLDVARMEAGKIHLEQKCFDMAQMIKAAEEESLATISTHTVYFAPVEHTPVFADEDKIEQVVTNFINNAVKYSPPGSTINVACIPTGDVVQVSVTDEGMGIAQQDLAHLFDRFYRVDNIEMKNVKGFGIGLYLCAEIINRHKGQIGVESEPGKGSTFWFTLPLHTVTEQLP